MTNELRTGKWMRAAQNGHAECAQSTRKAHGILFRLLRLQPTFQGEQVESVVLNLLA